MPVPKWDNWPHVIRTQQFSAQVLKALVAHATEIEIALMTRKEIPRRSRKRDWDVKEAFFENSTRTEDTFCAAARRLGCNVRVLPNPTIFSSTTKGESLQSSICVYTRVGGMGELRSTDMLIIRHAHEGTAERAAKIVDTANGDGVKKLPLPVINAGDGPGQHPTQALVDLFTIYRERKCDGHPLDDITICFSGDTKFGRTINSLAYLIGRFGDQHKIRVIFSTLDQLGPKPEILEYLSRHHITFDFVPDLKAAIKMSNVIYMTRIQRERPGMPAISREERLRYVFKREYQEILPHGTFVMHPLPINQDPEDPPAEIDEALMSPAIAGDPRYAWFRQSMRGIPMRIALLDAIFVGMDAEEDKCMLNFVRNGNSAPVAELV